MTNTERELLDGGDWACSHGNHGTLAQVCEELARLDPARLARRAWHIVELADVNMSAATREWSELADEVRRSEPRPQLPASLEDGEPAHPHAPWV